MPVTEQESHRIAVYAGQGETTELASAVKVLGRRESASTAEILIGCRDDFHQTAAHIAAKSGQTRNHAMAVDIILAFADTAHRLYRDPRGTPRQQKK